MPAVPLLRPRDAIRAFERFGWQVARQRGSHTILTKVGHIATLSIPDHREVARGTLRIPISKAGLTVEEFVAAYEGMLGADGCSIWSVCWCPPLLRRGDRNRAYGGPSGSGVTGSHAKWNMSFQSWTIVGVIVLIDGPFSKRQYRIGY
jgi:predicted RNA binding protein YcfA (HicA-like mRNA interferase family)